MGEEELSIRAIVQGKVQGVYFRAFVRQHALSLGLSGFVHNLPQGDKVEVHADGSRENLERLLEHLKRGPPGAVVKNLDICWLKSKKQDSTFEIRY